MSSQKTKTYTIDVTPKWENMIPLFMRFAQEAETRQTAQEELRRIARLADQVNDRAREERELYSEYDSAIKALRKAVDALGDRDETLNYDKTPTQLFREAMKIYEEANK